MRLALQYAQGLTARLFLPNRDTHHRAQAWHPLSFLVYSGFILVVSWSALSLPQAVPSILGYSSSITAKEIIERANVARTTRGIASLKANESLTNAAQAKARDMISKNYWAHISPSGTPPWDFITNAGYTYSIAGENLARNFLEPQSVVDAWIASPSHRDNLLNEHYTEIGVAVVNGVMNGAETTLVVQMFGKPALTPFTGKIPIKEVVIKEPSAQTGGAYEKQDVRIPQPALSAFTISKRFSIILLIFLGGLLILDYIVLLRRQVSRVGGHNAAHLLLLFFLIVALWYTKSGRVL